MRVGANSEYGRLEKVIIQPPGKEQDVVLPGDAIHPYFDPLPISYKEARKEYDALYKFLVEETGIENVLTVEQLLSETLASLDWPDQCRAIEEMAPQYRREIVAGRLGEIGANRALNRYSSDALRYAHASHLSQFLAMEILQGYPQWPDVKNDELEPLVFTPKRTMMWVRDCAAMTPAGAIICSMSKRRRDEEPAVLGLIFKHHPQFGESTIAVDLPKLQEQDGVRYILEGGNVQLHGHIVAIGMGNPDNNYANRTNAAGAEKVTRELFAKDTEGKIEQIMHVYIPDLSINIHLDSIFNIVGPKAAVAAPYVLGYPDNPEKYFGALRKRVERDMILAGEDPATLSGDTNYEKWGTAKVYTRESMATADDFESAGINVKFLDHLVSEGLLDMDAIAWVGGVDTTTSGTPNMKNFFKAQNEQADLAANVFCTGPFRMTTYDRNTETIHSLQQIRHNIAPALLYPHIYGYSHPVGKIVLMPSRELRTTWGGSHCTTLPLAREAI
jgi:arginine deiminase